MFKVKVTGQGQMEQVDSIVLLCDLVIFYQMSCLIETILLSALNICFDLEINIY